MLTDLLTILLSLLTHTQIMKNKTQKRLIIGTILLMQWILMIAACTAIYTYSETHRLIDLFSGLFMLFSSYLAHTCRISYFKTMIGAEKTAKFLNWLKNQNRATRRHHGFRMARSAKKAGFKRKKSR